MSHFVINSDADDKGFERGKSVTTDLLILTFGSSSKRSRESLICNRLRKDRITTCHNNLNNCWNMKYSLTYVSVHLHCLTSKQNLAGFGANSLWAYRKNTVEFLHPKYGSCNSFVVLETFENIKQFVFYDN